MCLIIANPHAPLVRHIHFGAKKSGMPWILVLVEASPNAQSKTKDKGTPRGMTT